MVKAQRSLADTAYARIRDEILGGQYPMGAPLSRRPLATELGMSFIPITEALPRLRRDGLVESKPRSGTRVKIPSAEEILGQRLRSNVIRSGPVIHGPSAAEKEPGVAVRPGKDAAADRA